MLLARAARAILCLLLVLPLILVSCSAPRKHYRIAVINEIAGHYEVISGLLHCLRDYQHDLAVFFNGRLSLTNTTGFKEWLGGQVGYWAEINNIFDYNITADVTISISAEFSWRIHAKSVKHLRSKRLLVFVHRADNSILRRVRHIHPNITYVALSPTVARYSQGIWNLTTHWILPILPWNPLSKCKDRSCFRHFCVQGSFEERRRNYATLWKGLLAHYNETGSLINVTVVGKGDVTRLHVPPELTNKVHILKSLPYQEYFDVISHSYALITAFGMDSYYTTRISSTVPISLITAVPIIASQRLVHAYTYFTESHVILRNPNETDVDAMVRAIKMPAVELLEKRVHLELLRNQLNTHAIAFLRTFVESTHQTQLSWKVKANSSNFSTKVNNL